MMRGAQDAIATPAALSKITEMSDRIISLIYFPLCEANMIEAQRPVPANRPCAAYQALAEPFLDNTSIFDLPAPPFTPEVAKTAKFGGVIRRKS